MTLTRNLKDSNLILILLFSLLLRLLYGGKYTTIWWDSAVYLSIGRYLFSSGMLGFIEPLRPLALPFLLGLSWKLGINDLLFSRLLGLAFSLLLITATYLLGKQESRDIATISAILISLSTVTFSFTFRNYTEIPAALCIVISLFCVTRKRYLFAGANAALAFLFKFPAGIILLPLLISAKKIKNVLLLTLSFAITVSPYFIYNFLTYGSFTQPLIEGSNIIKEAGIWIFAQPWHFYFKGLLKENILYIFALMGIFTIFKKEKRLIPLTFLFIFLYFIHLDHKEMRFMVLLLPLLAIITARGIKMLFKSENTAIYVFLITLLFFFLTVPSTFDSYKPTKYHTFLKDKQVSKEILTMHPVVALYAPRSVTLAYFPVFNSTLADHWIQYVQDNKKEIAYIFLDTCEGGMLCPPLDPQCEQKKESLIALAQSTFSLAYEKESQGCRYYIFQN